MDFQRRVARIGREQFDFGLHHTLHLRSKGFPFADKFLGGRYLSSKIKIDHFPLVFHVTPFMSTTISLSIEYLLQITDPFLASYQLSQELLATLPDACPLFQKSATCLGVFPVV